MRVFGRRGDMSAEILERLALAPREKALAWATSTDGSWIVGTRKLLVLLTPEERVTMPWEQVEDVSWDSEAERLRVVGVGDYGQPRPSYVFEMEEPALLLQLIRERVMASIMLQRRVPVRDRLGLTVIGRRSPVGGPVTWMHAYDEGLDPHDPDVAETADRALAQAQSEVGESI